MWDATQYGQFRGERSRPFFDLLGRIPDRGYKTIVDLGCGTGDLTAALAEHWPEARVLGVDLSEEMLAPARERENPGVLDFVQGDLATWRPAQPVELIVSNAAFQWVADHPALLAHVSSFMAPKGVLAVQMPGNFESPSHLLLHETAGEGLWAEKLRGKLRRDIVLTPAQYVDLAWARHLEIDAWETVYQHVLPGRDAVLEWVKGTALRPVMNAIEGAELDEFLFAYAAKLRKAYPETPSGTRFPFRRVFFIARKR
jgi:trans-aconitate 2-methyltransferase